MTMDEIIAKLRANRASIDAIKERHKAELAPYVGWDAEMTAKLIMHLENTGQESIRTNSGTIYKTTRNHWKITDLAAFQEHVITTQEWGLTVWRANETNSESYFQSHGMTKPPGTERTPEAVLHVNAPRKPKPKGNGEDKDQTELPENYEAL